MGTSLVSCLVDSRCKSGTRAEGVRISAFQTNLTVDTRSSQLAFLHHCTIHVTHSEPVVFSKGGFEMGGVYSCNDV